MQNLLQDLRYAVRTLLKSPGFTIVAVLTLALGIGATTAIFSLIHSVLIESLPYPEPERLVQVFEARPDGGLNQVSGGAFKDWKENQSSFEYLAIYEETRMNLTGAGAPERVTGLRASSEFLSALGVAPVVGRDFAAEEVTAGNNRVVLLTHRFWQQRYGGDARVTGETLVLDQTPYTIIGVLPPHALLQDAAMYVVPIVIDDDPEAWRRAGHWREAVGRVRPGVTIAAAEAELRTIKESLDAHYPSFKQDWSVAVLPVREAYAGAIRTTVLVLFGAVAFVLLIACTNVSNLLLARAGARAREMSVRSVLGASSARIVRQVLVESVLLALLGCTAGLLLAFSGVGLLSGMVSDMLPFAMQPEVDGTVLAFSIAVACGCGVLFGILPALRAGRANITVMLKEGERGSLSADRKRSQSALLATQFAFTLMLLIGAGLLLRSFVLLLEVDPGFEPSRTLVFDLSFPEAKYPDAASRLRVIDELTGRVAAVPGVESVGVTSSVPLSDAGHTEFLSRADRPFSADYTIGYEAVSGDYLDAMGIELLRGRFIQASDNRSHAPRVLVVSSGVAEDLYPGENPLGQRLRLSDKSWEIVGVVEPVRHGALNVGVQPRVYSAHAYFPWSTSLVVRTAVAPLTLTEPVRKAVLAADPDQPIANVRTLEQAVHDAIGSQRAMLILLGFFAAVAVALACVGNYGVMSCAIGQREREYGIRAALGASRRDIGAVVMKTGLKPALAGMVVGVFAAVVLARFLESLLFEVEARDPRTFAAAVVLLACVAALAVWIPARRAAQAAPIEALRQE